MRINVNIQRLPLNVQCLIVFHFTIYVLQLARTLPDTTHGNKLETRVKGKFRVLPLGVAPVGFRGFSQYSRFPSGAPGPQTAGTRPEQIIAPESGEVQVVRVLQSSYLLTTSSNEDLTRNGNMYIYIYIYCHYICVGKYTYRQLYMDA